MEPITSDVDALLAQHDTRPPSLSFDECTARLRAAAQGQKGDLKPEPAISDSIVAYLAYTLTPLGASLQLSSDASNLYEFALEGLESLPMKYSESIRNIALNVAHPAHLSSLTEVILRLNSADTLARGMIEELKGANQLHIVNVLNLIYFVKSTHPEAFDQTITREIQNAFLALEKRAPTFMPITQMTIQEFDLLSH